MRNDIITAEFTNALRDYAFLLNRSYPRKSILKIVGDRYLLNTYQRVLLSRGVFPDADVRGRIRKTRLEIGAEDLYIDAYNVLFTVCNYLLGRMVFIANDRFVRDTGELYGKPLEDPVFSRAIDMCLGFLKKKNPSGIRFLLDSPVSHSAELAGKLRELIISSGLKGDAQISKNPDAVLIKQNQGLVVTSDSDILDNTDRPVADLARLILEDSFELQLPDLGSLLA